jgi:hypothetical protein
MIEGPGGWLDTCQKAGVNHMAVEYKRFSDDKEYQKAINAKPYFIKRALELCAPRAVVYIDGDMIVNKYPSIFDMEDVDFMARNWNCDPRSKDDYEDSPGADFYTFETSGGIMYFGQTHQAHSLLDSWIKTTERKDMKNKADDRILSLIFNQTCMYLPLNIVQLPVEYLWLTMIYGGKPLADANRRDIQDIYSKAIIDSAKRVNRHRLVRELMSIEEGGFMDMRPMKFVRNGKPVYEDPWNYVFIEHPHCLTPEEVAREKSQATVNRQPVNYNRNVTDRVGFRGGGWFHDYIFFDSEEQSKAFLPYQYYTDTHTFYEEEYYNDNSGQNEIDEVPLFYHERYSDRYGLKYNRIAAENERLVMRLDKQTHKSPPSRTTDCPAGDVALSAPCKVVKSPAIPQILYHLQKGLDVLYVPTKARPDYINAVVEEAEKGNNQLITVNISTMKATSKPHDLKSEYLLSIPPDAPIYFGSRSKILQHLLRMCKNLNDLPKLFNSSIVFLTRIRCEWVAKPENLSTVRGEFMEPIPRAAEDNKKGSEGAEALVNPASPAEQIAVINRLPELIDDKVIPERIPYTNTIITHLDKKFSELKIGGRRLSQKMDKKRFLTKTRKNLRRQRA